jgi:LmbE family N-acetylglucosaminyl deacetylase
MLNGVGGTRTFVFVVAHPDDDAYGMAGTVALHAADPDFRYVLVHATDGGAGDIRDGFPATRQTLGAVRRAECEAAWRAHGRMPDRHEWLDYPDGAVNQAPFGELVDRIAAILDEEAPAVVATFGPDGITAHPDHIAVGAATDD